MRYHPLLEGFDAPRAVVLGPYHLSVLGPDSVEEDYAAVMESQERLFGLMGGTWPDGLTLDENRVDLCWHVKEFAMKRSFAWIVRNSDGAYLGCAYVFPDFAGNGAFVPVWMRSSVRRDAHEATFGALLMDWLTGPDWPDFEFRLHLPGDTER